MPSIHWCRTTKTSLYIRVPLPKISSSPWASPLNAPELVWTGLCQSLVVQSSIATSYCLQYKPAELSLAELIQELSKRLDAKVPWSNTRIQNVKNKTIAINGEMAGGKWGCVKETGTETWRRRSGSAVLRGLAISVYGAQCPAPGAGDCVYRSSATQHVWQRNPLVSDRRSKT